jgi:hypothetical protein
MLVGGNMAKKSDHIIEISFKVSELELLYRIKVRCKYMSISSWLKEAAYEKLEREENPDSFYSQPPTKLYKSKEQMEDPNKLPVSINGVNSLLNMFGGK